MGHSACTSVGLRQASVSGCSCQICRLSVTQNFIFMYHHGCACQNVVVTNQESHVLVLHMLHACCHCCCCCFVPPANTHRNRMKKRHQLPKTNFASRCCCAPAMAVKCGFKGTPVAVVHQPWQ